MEYGFPFVFHSDRGALTVSNNEQNMIPEVPDTAAAEK